MRIFTRTIEVSARAERVWEVMSDVERWHEWTPSVTSIKRRDHGPLALGSRAVVKQPKFPPALWKVAELEPGRSFTWVSSGPGFKAVGRHSVQPAGLGSKATLTLEYRGALGGLFGRMTKGITDRYLDREASGLKARSENPSFRHAE